MEWLTRGQLNSMVLPTQTFSNKKSLHLKSTQYMISTVLYVQKQSPVLKSTVKVGNTRSTALLQNTF